MTKQATPSLPQTCDTNLCKHPSGDCARPRAASTTGGLHDVCEHHREIENKALRQSAERAKRPMSDSEALLSPTSDASVCRGPHSSEQPSSATERPGDRPGFHSVNDEGSGDQNRGTPQWKRQRLARIVKEFQSHVADSGDQFQVLQVDAGPTMALRSAQSQDDTCMPLRMLHEDVEWGDAMTLVEDYPDITGFLAGFESDLEEEDE